jgi:hypothetical protein
MSNINRPVLLVWVATAAIVAGFGLIAYTWDKVSTLTIVAAQVPYIVSAGFSGLGLIVLGGALLVVWSRRADDQQRQRAADGLADALHEIHAALARETE